MFAGYIVAIFVLMAVAIAVIQKSALYTKDSKNEYYREQAINVAKAGFEDGVSLFRRTSDGIYLAAYPQYAPTSYVNLTYNPWPLWPDSAFMPGSNDTDYYSALSVTTWYNGVSVFASAGGLVRTVALESFSTTITAGDRKTSRLWGRYVLRRQNVRNWDPAGNTSMVNSDPEAAHDITHIRSQNLPGTGNYWSLFSRGYVFTNATDITVPAAHQGGSLLNAPLRLYQNHQLLRATASVYGELTRLNFNTPNAAVFIGAGSNLAVQATGVVQGINGYGCARSSNATTPTVATGGLLTGSINTYAPTTNMVPPSFAYVFPGQNQASLMAAADITVADNTGFPNNQDPLFSDTVSRTRFIYCTSTSMTTFVASDKYVMSGVGLVIFNGGLTIQAKNQSAWAGVVYVKGNVNIRGPGNISGLLICEGTVTIGYSADNDKAVIEYNSDAISTTQSYLQKFKVIASSVVVTGH